MAIKTKADFFEKWREVCELDETYVYNLDPELRCELDSVIQRSLCPIIAVCYHVTGELFDNDEFVLAGHKMGMPEELSLLIADAADGKEGASPETYDPALRQKLLDDARISNTIWSSYC